MAESPYPISQQLGHQIDTEPQFQPMFDAQQTQKLIDHYQVSPNTFTPEDIDKLKKHANFHQQPMYDGEFTIGEALKQFGQGVFSGFTTFNVGAAPDNEYEAIARSMGHLIGFAPGMVAKPLMKVKALEGWARKLSTIKSVPMWGAEKIRKQAVKLTSPLASAAIDGKYSAVKTAGNFLNQKKVKHIAEGAFDLGVASGLSAWQGGIDEMLTSTFHGATAGAVFRGLGNFVNMGDANATKLTRALAGSLFMGLQAEQRGATTPEKVYEYLLGAFFGYGEAPYHKANAAKFMKEVQKKRVTDPEFSVTLNPELMGEKWAKLDKLEKAEVEKNISEQFFNGGDINTGRAWGAMLIEQLPERYKDKYGNVTKEGWEEARKIKDAIVKGEAYETPSEEVIGPAQERLGKKIAVMTERLERDKLDMATMKKTVEVETKAQKDGERGHKLIFAEDKVKSLTDKIAKDQETLLKLREGIGKDDLIEKTENPDTDSDVGERTSEIRIGKRAAWFAEKWMKDTWDIDADIHIKKDLKTVTSARIEKIIRDGIVEGSQKEVDIDAISEKLQKEFGTPIEPDARLELKQWLNRLSKGVHQNYMRVVIEPDRAGTKTSPAKRGNIIWQPMYIKRPITKAGNKKDNIEPMKQLERIYLEESGGELDIDWGHLVHVDHMSMKNKSGQWKDYTLAQMRKNNPKEYAESMRRIQKSMHDKGFYIFGGRGDSDKFIFMKYHPRAKKFLKDAILKELKGDGKAYKEAYEMYKNQFPKGTWKNSKMKESFDKAFASNVLYDVGMQGFEYNKANYRAMWNSTDKNAFLNNALDFNKRLQILLTPAWDGSKKLADATFKGDKVYNRKGTEGRKGFKASLIEDVEAPREHKELLYRMAANKFEEGTDGAIIVNDKVLDFFNIDSGNPVSGQNKAFIISPDSKLGGLFGKFMFHKAGPKMSAQMEKTGHHMLIYKSSAKQRGLREVGNYELSPRGKLTVNAPIYTIDPTHIKYNYSVKQGKEMYTHDARLAKQWFSGLNSRVPFKPIPKDVINDIFDETIAKSYRGDEAWNAKLSDYLKEPNTKKLQGIIKNLEKVGVNELLDAMQKNEGTRFADAAYEKLFKINKELIVDAAREEGAKESELIESSREIDDFDTVTSRLLKEAHDMARGNDLKASSLYMHKWIRPYRLSVMRNYIMGQVVKPKMGNSAAARMRPYDKAMIMNLDKETGGSKFLPLLNDKNVDNIFFLDNAYRDMSIRTHLGGKWGETTLGELWDATQHKTDKKQFKGLEAEVDEIFRAMVLRVPMDSMSGAQALNFRGFTGRDGHGILLHPKKMRFLGGADLDGDEAFMFFGGKDAAGRGEGMKKTWKDAFEANAKEYVEYVSKEKINGKYKYLTKDEYKNLGKPVLEDSPEMSLPTKINPPLSSKSGVSQSKGAYISLRDNYDLFKGLIKESGTVKWNKGVAWYGDIPYSYSGVHHKAQGMPGEFQQIARSIEKELGLKKGYFNSALVNLMPKKTSLGEHQDNEPIFIRDNKTIGKVATISLGSNADIVIRKGYKGPEEVHTIEEGDLYVMPGKTFQHNYTHEVLKVPGERMSFTFRHIPQSKLKGKPKLSYISKKKLSKKNLNKLKPEQFTEYILDPKKGKVNRPDGKYGDMKMEALLTESEGDFAIKASSKYKDSRVWMYAPNIRQMVSEKVVDGRALMGGVVSMTQSMKAAHDVIASTKNGRDKFQMMVKDNNNDIYWYTVEVAARKGKEWMDYTRRLSASMTAFTADPMDVAGLRTYNEYFGELYDAYFEVKSVKRNSGKKTSAKSERDANKKFSVKDIDSIEKLKDHFKAFEKGGKKKDHEGRFREGIVKDVMDMNGALFSRNWNQGRMFHEHEIRDRLEFIKKHDKDGIDSISNIMGKQASLLRGTPQWTENIFNKVSKEKLEKLYEDINVTAKEYEFLAGLMGRSSFTIPQSAFVKQVFDYNLSDPINIDILSKRKYHNRFRSIFEFQDQYGNKKLLGYTRKRGETKEEFIENIDNLKSEEKVEILHDVFRQAQDFIVNDMHQMISLKKITELYDANKEEFTIDVIRDIFNEVERTKQSSALMSKNRNDTNIFYRGREQMNDAEKSLYDTVMKDLIEVGDVRPEEISAEMDQNQIDARIKKYKSEKLDSTAKKKLYDYLMLGSFNRNESAKRFTAKELEKHPYIRHQFVMDGAKTSLTRLGFQSTAIDRTSIRSFLKEYMNLSAESFKADKTDLAKTIENVRKMGEMEVTIDGEGIKLAERDAPIGAPAEEYMGENLSGYIGLKLNKTPTKDQNKVMVELAENLKYYDKGKTLHLNEITRQVMRKDMNAMDVQDWRIMNEVFKDYRHGTFAQRLFKEDSPNMKKRFWMLFPEKVSKSQMKYDIEFMKERGYFTAREGKRLEGWVRRPTWVLEDLVDWNGKLAAKSQDLAEQLQIQLNSTLSFYTDAIPEEGETLRRIAVRKMELGQINRILYGKSESESTGGINKNNELRRHDAESYSKAYLEEIGGKGNYETAEPTGEAKIALEKKYNITHPNGEKESLTGYKVVEKIQDTYTAMNKEAHKMITGDPAALDPYRTGSYFDKKTKLEPKLDWSKFVKDIENLYKQGKPLPTNLGIDGVRQIARSMLIDLAPTKEIAKQLTNTRMARTGKLDFGTYFPHMFMSTREAKAAMEKAIVHIKNDSKMSEDQKAVEMKKVLLRTHNLTGDWIDPGQELFDAYDRAISELNLSKTKREETVNWWNSNQTMGSMHARNTHIPGWDIGRETYEVYLRNVGHTYFNQINQIFSRYMIEKFKQKMTTKPYEWHKEKTGYRRDENGKKVPTTLLDNWVNYLKLYTQDAMGNPAIIPEKIYSDPAMKLKGTPYYWWADNRVKKKMEHMKKTIMGNRASKYPELDKLKETLDYSTLNKISNLEAKFELMSLLAHPKASVANMFGGTMHTIQSAGFDSFRKGRNLKYLNKIDPSLKTVEDVDAFVTKHGVIPEFMIHQLGIDPKIRGGNYKNFMKDFSKKITKSGEMDETTLRDIGKKNRVGTNILNIAAKFMSVPERTLRRDAFMAHLVKNYEMFDGAIKDINHPFLVELATKGVKATQFLYSAPYRPAFARTSLGKIMTRFQLWQWNAVRFRNDVARDARIYGIAEGTPEFDRFTRTLQLDMLVFALGNAFAYSIFDTAMPAPYSWYQDTADWLFGNENERDRAFFGAYPRPIAPLQLVSPPIMRHPLSVLKSLYTNDWERFSKYHVYTMFPFGRLGKDFLAPNNLIENPMGLIDKWAGFPMQKLNNESKKMRKGKGPWYPWHPHGIERESSGDM